MIFVSSIIIILNYLEFGWIILQCCNFNDFYLFICFPINTIMLQFFNFWLNWFIALILFPSFFLIFSTFRSDYSASATIYRFLRFYHFYFFPFFSSAIMHGIAGWFDLNFIGKHIYFICVLMVLFIINILIIDIFIIGNIFAIFYIIITVIIVIIVIKLIIMTIANFIIIIYLV